MKRYKTVSGDFPPSASEVTKLEGDEQASLTSLVLFHGTDGGASFLELRFSILPKSWITVGNNDF